MSSSRLLVRNTLLNMAGQVVPMLAAIIAIPLFIQRLGAPRFGVLTLAWAAIGYFSLFDLGLSRALTQAVAVRLGMREDERDLTAIAWTSLWLMLILGVAGAIALAVLTPWLTGHVLNIPAGLRRESVVAFYLLALSLPCVVTTAGLRGLLEAHQHFGAATALRIPLAVFTFVGPLLVLPFSSSLVPIVAVLVVGRVLTWVAYVIVCVRRYDYMSAGVEVRRRVIGPLMRYGGWLTVSNVVSPLMANMDRFVIGAILPLAAVAHYVTPFEVVSKLLVLPQSMMAALFPAFASGYVVDRGRTTMLFERALRAMVLLMFPVLFAIVLFAPEGLTLWVGAEFARASTPVLRWLAIGVFINSLAQPPVAILQGGGRPDLTAWLHLVELPLYAVMLWYLIHRFGIVGVAAAWTLRVVLDTASLLFFAYRAAPAESPHRSRSLSSTLGALCALMAACVVQGTTAKVVFLLGTAVAYVLVGWTQVIHPDERESLRGWAKLAFNRSAPRVS
jgi:O-antigen/teichoic acid export membrane protein